jgi:tetratricopeptide (TPR) repeat protein
MKQFDRILHLFKVLDGEGKTMRIRFGSWVVAVAITMGVAALCGASVFGQHHNKHDERALREDPRLAPGQIAPMLEGLGDLHHPITTASERAQSFFDQGLRLTYGFNHQEALRAFKEAARLDPDAAMAYWGWALVLGPNLNLPMQEEVVAQAFEAMQMAVAARGKVSQPERDYIDALAVRYTDDPEADRAPLDRAYAEAMKTLHEKYPDDTDAATLYAAALMNLSPWNYWNRDGRPRESTPEILETLEWVFETDPEHIGALHYYIHAVEPVDAGRGVEAADLLRGLTPGAGHLVHMPSHIYMQVGRYDDSFSANSQAVLADEGYITQCRAQGIYPLGYYPHNIHFLAWSALMQGRSKVALDASRKVAGKVPDDYRQDGVRCSKSRSRRPIPATGPASGTMPGEWPMPAPADRNRRSASSRP